jgi:hypothetical protein
MYQILNANPIQFLITHNFTKPYNTNNIQHPKHPKVASYSTTYTSLFYPYLIILSLRASLKIPKQSKLPNIPMLHSTSRILALISLPRHTPTTQRTQTNTIHTHVPPTYRYNFSHQKQTAALPVLLISLPFLLV